MLPAGSGLLPSHGQGNGTLPGPATHPGLGLIVSQLPWPTGRLRGRQGGSEGELSQVPGEPATADGAEATTHRCRCHRALWSHPALPRGARSLLPSSEQWQLPCQGHAFPTPRSPTPSGDPGAGGGGRAALGFSFLAWCSCCCFSCARLFEIAWTVARQALLSMRFSRQEYWRGMPSPSPGESSRPRDGTRISCIACIASRFFTAKPPGMPSSAVK